MTLTTDLTGEILTRKLEPLADLIKHQLEKKQLQGPSKEKEEAA